MELPRENRNQEKHTAKTLEGIQGEGGIEVEEETRREEELTMDLVTFAKLPRAIDGGEWYVWKGWVI